MKIASDDSHAPDIEIHDDEIHGKQLHLVYCQDGDGEARIVLDHEQTVTLIKTAVDGLLLLMEVRSTLHG